MTVDILGILSGKWEDGTRPKDVYKLYVSKEPADYVMAIVEGLSSTERRVQNGSAEVASYLSETNPEMLYPHLQLFLRNLKAKEPVIRWEAVCTLGNLASVDSEEVIPGYIDAIMPYLEDKSIVLQGHTVRALAKIAKVFPDTAPGILESLIGVIDYYPGNRVGFIVEAMEFFKDYENLQPKVKEFVEPYIDSDMKVVARKARRTSKRLS